MADVVNLRTVRKRKARSERERAAEHNRAKFGTPKQVRELGTARDELEQRRHEGHRLETPVETSSPDKPDA